MSFYEEVEKITVNSRAWFKIKADGAFVDILDGFEEYRPVYEKHTVKKGTAVQAGGYCGVFPRLLGEMFKTVYTFEPDPLNFFCLNLNCQTENIIKAQGGLGDDHGLVSVIRQHNNNRGMNYLQKNINSYVPVYRIDDLELTSCDLIQLDTEGYEYKILLGAANTINLYRPLISVEDSNEKIRQYLAVLGYKEVATVYRDTVYKCER